MVQERLLCWQKRAGDTVPQLDHGLPEIRNIFRGKAGPGITRTVLVPNIIIIFSTVWDEAVYSSRATESPEVAETASNTLHYSTGLLCEPSADPVGKRRDNWKEGREKGPLILQYRPGALGVALASLSALSGSVSDDAPSFCYPVGWLGRASRSQAGHDERGHGQSGTGRLGRTWRALAQSFAFVCLGDRPDRARMSG